MWHRLQRRFLVWAAKFQPVLIIILSLGILFAGYLSRELHLQSPATPLEKLSGHVEAVESYPSNNSKRVDEAEKIVVSITGAVSKPGVYEFELSGDGGAPIVQSLIEKANGYTDKADLLYVSQKINLARQLASGEQIYIPSVDEQKLLVGSGTAGTGSDGNTQAGGSESTGLININSASSSQLETLPGVGPSTAGKIIAARPYSSIEDIKNVSGIGDATYDKLKDLITV